MCGGKIFRKSIIKSASFFAFILVTASFSKVCAQSPDQMVRYRVTAYKAGDNTVTSVSNVSEVAPLLTLFIPNSFTPNNDGLNDEFCPKGKGIQSYSMVIYNRWGEIVFQSDEEKTKWDGKVNGQLAMEGSYRYMISVKGMDGEVAYKNGNVTMIR